MSAPIDSTAQPQPREVAGVFWGTAVELGELIARNASKWAAREGVPAAGMINLLFVFGPDRGFLEELLRIDERVIGGADPIGMQLRKWLEDCCDRKVDPNTLTRTRHLYEGFRRWALPRRLYISETLFSRRLRTLGVEHLLHPRTRQSCFIGIALRPGPSNAE